MKVFCLLALVGVVSSARLDNTYLPPNSAKTAGGNGQFLNTPFNNGHNPSTQYGTPLSQANHQAPNFGKSSFNNGFSASSKFNSPAPVYGAPVQANGFQKSIAPAPVYGSPAQANGFQKSLSPAPVYGAPVQTNGFQKSISPAQVYGAPVQANGFQKSISPAPVYGAPGQANGHAFRSNNPEVHARTVNAENNNDGSGNYQYDYETENHIALTEQGQVKPTGDGATTVVQGRYSYVGDDGKTYAVDYIADENGFQPVGEHIDHAISMGAKEAARNAVPEVQGGYSYGGQQGYTQNGYSGYQAQGGYSQHQGVQNGYQHGDHSQNGANNGGYRY